MEIASNKGVIADASTPAGRAGMSESEWREAIKFDSTDTGLMNPLMIFIKIIKLR